MIDVIQSKRGDGGYPDIVYIDPKVLEFMKDGDALSQQLTVFKYGGKTNSGEAIPFKLVKEQ